MSWKIKTDPETPFLFTPGGSGAGGYMVPFDIEGLKPGDWWLSGTADLGQDSGPRTSRFWWQAKSGTTNTPPAGQYISYYAATVDDIDVTNIGGLAPGSGTGNYLINGQGNQITEPCAPIGVPNTLIASTWNTGCSCFGGPFTLSYDNSLGVWTSGPLYCPGVLIPFYAQYNCIGFGFAPSGSIIGSGGSALSQGSVIGLYPFTASGAAWAYGNTSLWCNSSTVNWLVHPTNAIPVPANLQYIGALATDNTAHFVTSGYVEIESRYVNLLAYNGTTTSLSPSGVDHQFYLLPIPDEVQ